MRALDLDLARALGYAKPHNIRNVIRRHLGALETRGGIVSAVKPPGRLGGRPAVQFLLTESQAGYIARRARPRFFELSPEEISRLFTHNER
jgi:predicted ArsR family transcriptional regulator